MARAKVKDPKKPTSISIRAGDLKRYHQAMKKLDLTGLNAFMEMAANNLASEVLQDNPERDIPDLAEEVAKMSKAVRSLSTQMKKMNETLEGLVLVDA